MNSLREGGMRMKEISRTPEEIKKGLETCIGKCTGNKPHCPYHECGDGCMDTMNRNALALIQQLEEKYARAMENAKILYARSQF